MLHSLPGEFEEGDLMTHALSCFSQPTELFPSLPAIGRVGTHPDPPHSQKISFSTFDTPILHDDKLAQRTDATAGYADRFHHHRVHGQGTLGAGPLWWVLYAPHLLRRPNQKL